MQTGSLNQYIEVQRQQPVLKTDGSGDRETVWTTIFPIYGRIADASVRDFISARKEQKVIATRIMLRQDDIEPNTQASSVLSAANSTRGSSRYDIPDA